MTEQSILERLSDMVQVHANAKQVYGEPVERNGVTIIPVARVQWGFGGGGIGRGPGERGGGGGGVRATPIGFIEIHDGTAEFRPIDNPEQFAVVASAGAIGLIGGLLLARLFRG